jgi:RNA polymerase sigma-54 factor
LIWKVHIDKYMETPIGIIKIQDLFSANVGNHASKSIQHRIIQIIQNEIKNQLIRVPLLSVH